MFAQGCRYFLHFSCLAFLVHTKVAFPLPESQACDATIN
ncbi:MAG: hypothetical protein QG556_224, partial [Pseudomonadota bacterium]|nr:hypothetical protein [Pseudomonadota bacterium]